MIPSKRGKRLMNDENKKLNAEFYGEGLASEE